ncbi:MAG TPA: tetratricopeptide repeat protein [Candidatus Limnocylindrales bacterium]|nr:tetratricopeptide repeat protein [Candidatus Limnocylindrales bacterium]
MSLFKKLFGQKPHADKPAEAGIDAGGAPADPASDPNMVRVYDSYDRELFITRQVWRDSILPGQMKKVWDDPDSLYSTIVQSLKDGFAAEMIQPAERLGEIDHDAQRAIVVLATVYRMQKRLNESDEILRRHIARHGESGVILTNLAKVHADRGEHDEVLQTLWRGLQLDPNQENGLGWYEAIHREKDGATAGLEAFRRVAALPGAWRARLWLARDALARRDLSAALRLYDEALSLAPTPKPIDLLQQISGDLGTQGYLEQILALAEPHFDPNVHGVAIGNNLIKAHLDLGQLDAAQRMLDRLFSFKRPDWHETLAFWDTEIARNRAAKAGADLPAVPKITTVVVDGPLWLRASTGAAGLVPAKRPGAVIVACLGSSFTAPDVSSGSVRMQLSDVPGRTSRALPLYLAEQLHLRTDAVGRVLQPWIQEGHCGFVLCGDPWSDERAVAQARGGNQSADYVVVLHLDGVANPWSATLRLVRISDGSLLGTAVATFTAQSPQPGFDRLATALMELIASNAGVRRATAPDFYQVPAGADFAAYQLRLEQALAVSLTATCRPEPGFLNGEREIVAGNLQLCSNQPSNPTPRLLLVHTLLQLQKLRPDVVLEFKDKIALLQKEKPLTGPAGGIVHSILGSMFEN